MLKFVSKKINGTFVSAVAALSMLATLFAGAAPASATGYTPAANSNISSYSAVSTWTIGSSNSVTLANAKSASWYAYYSVDTTSLVGKTLTASSSVTGLPAGFSASASFDFSYNSRTSDGNNGYIYNNIGNSYLYSGSIGGQPAVVPNNTARVTMSVRIYINGSSSGITIPTGTYTPTFTVMADGVALTRNDVYSSPFNGDVSVLHLADYSEPSFTQATTGGAFTGSASYRSVNTIANVCVPISGLSAGDTLNIHPLFDGAEVTGLSQWRVWTQSLDSGTNSASGFSPIVTQDQVNTGEMLLIKWDNNFQSDITSGNHTFGVSVTKNGTEVSAPCETKPLPAGSTPGVIYDASNAYGPAGLFVKVDQIPSLANKSWAWKMYKASDNTLVASGEGNGNTRPVSTRVCGVSGCVSPVGAGVPVYVKVSTSRQLDSQAGDRPFAYGPLSNASTTAQIPDPWISATAPSGGTGAGEAKVISSTIDYTAADSGDVSMMSPAGANAYRAVSDGKNGVLKPRITFPTSPSDNTPLSAKLFRIGANGIDTTFGGGANGITLKTISGSAPTMISFVNVGWFGARNKWSAMVQVADYSGNTPVNTYELYNGTFTSSSAGTPIVLTSAALSAQCAGSGFGVNLYPISAATSTPLYSLYCNKWVSNNNGGYSLSYAAIIKVAANGTITKLTDLNVGDGTTDVSWRALISYTNVNASQGSDVAYTTVGYTADAAGNVVAKKAYVITVDGSVSSLDNAYSTNETLAINQPGFIAPKVSAGSSTTIIQKTSTGYKTGTVAANGLVTMSSTDDLTVETIAGLDNATFSFVEGQEVGTTGKVQLLRRLGTSKIAQATFDIDAKTIDTGEVVTYVNSTDSRVINFTFLDAQGRVNWMFTSANSKLTNIRWGGLAGGGALPDGVEVTSVSTKYITNAAATVTITGRGLNTFAGTKLTIGTAQVAPSSKSATKLVVTIPAGTTAGDITINGTFGGSDATLATVTRVGAAKQSQTIEDTADSIDNTWDGVSNKKTVTFPATTSVGLPTSLKVDKAAICSVSGQTVTMNAAGTCVVTVASAGDLGTNAVTQNTTIVVAPRTSHNVTTILTALAAAGTTWTGTNQAVTLPSLLSSYGLAVTVTVAPAAVCTIAGAVVTLKAAGTCAVSVSAASDAGTAAVAKTVSNVVVAKGDLDLSVESTLSITNNPADISGDTLNVRSVYAQVASGAADDVEFTYASSDENICTVDEDGNVTGVAEGTCTITTDADAGANWLADEKTTTVTVAQSSTEIPDTLPEVGDGNLSPKPVVSNKSAFVPTNDSSLLVKWDKAAGLLTLQSKGVYTGFIKAEITFTALNNGGTFTCTNVFGTTSAMASKTAAQRKAALKTKVFTAAAAACKDASGLSVPDSISAVTDFAKIKKVAKDTKAANTVPGSAKYEALAFSKLKNFSGNMTIKVTRYRAWPTTMKNLSGTKKIPATVRTTVIALQ